MFCLKSHPNLEKFVRRSKAADAQRDEDPATSVRTLGRVLTQLLTDLTVDFIPNAHTKTHTPSKLIVREIYLFIFTLRRKKIIITVIVSGITSPASMVHKNEEQTFKKIIN